MKIELIQGLIDAVNKDDKAVDKYVEIYVDNGNILNAGFDEIEIKDGCVVSTRKEVTKKKKSVFTRTSTIVIAFENISAWKIISTGWR